MMTYPLHLIGDAHIKLLSMNGYRITGKTVGGMLCVIATRNAAGEKQK